MPPLKSESTVTYGQLIKYTFMMFSVLVILMGAVVGYALQEGNQNSDIKTTTDNLGKLERVVNQLVIVSGKHQVDIAVLKKTAGIQ